MRWKKLGRIFNPQNCSFLRQIGATHSAVPFIYKYNKKIRVFFSARDEENRSFVTFFEFKFNKQQVITYPVYEKKILSHGELGTFDDSGAMGSCLLKDNNKYYLYYIGWNLGVTVPFRNSIGIAISEDAINFKKMFKGPILDRTKTEPHFNASCCVIKDEEKYKIWYLSCVGWFKRNNKIQHKYHIKYAESYDKINWKRNGKIAIDFQDKYEYAISVPRVIKINNKYHMWFSSRATENSESYRIRHAISYDGQVWNRSKKFEIDVSKIGWDSEMVCYPYVCKHDNNWYMLYNGNGYGKTGIGLAVLEGELE